MALYTATGDTATRSGCTGTCLSFWPPLLLPAGQAQPVAGTGVTGVGTFMRAEGVQVTYNGKPLYTWFKDGQPGQVTGDGVVDSGGTWHVATITTGTGSGVTAPTTPAPTMTPASVSPATTVPPAPSGGGASF
jgi:Secreted repeat of unknown function